METKEFISITIRKTSVREGTNEKTDIIYEQKFSYPDKISDNDVYSLIAELNSVNEIKKDQEPS